MTNIVVNRVNPSSIPLLLLNNLVPPPPIAPKPPPLGLCIRIVKIRVIAMSVSVTIKNVFIVCLVLLFEEGSISIIFLNVIFNCIHLELGSCYTRFMIEMPILIVCFFTFIIHMTESLAYSMRLAGVRTKQIAIAMAFVTSTLLVSRLSNMFQAPLLGAMVDLSILDNGKDALLYLESQFRLVIFSAFFGACMGAFLTPTVVGLFQKAIIRFKHHGSVPRVMVSVFYPKNTWKILKSFHFPRLSALKTISFRSLPKSFLIINICVTSVYCIGVLCSLLAGAYLPEFRSTAVQLSGIVNGMATIMFTMFVDPSGARVTDQAVNGERPEADVRSVVFFLQMGKIMGTLILAQLLFKPLTKYIMFVTEFLSKTVA